jgi:hypothetical protein
MRSSAAAWMVALLLVAMAFATATFPAASASSVDQTGWLQDRANWLNSAENRAVTCLYTGDSCEEAWDAYAFQVREYDLTAEGWPEYKPGLLEAKGLPLRASTREEIVDAWFKATHN